MTSPMCLEQVSFSRYCSGMRITAEMIEQWADLHEARAELPILVRRLIGRPLGASALAMPGGAAVGLPGFDGIVDGAVGDAWIPAGSSRWELGCGSSPGDKATADYGKRTLLSDPALRANAAFVFVTPRRWTGKTAWVDRTSRSAEWREVRAYDAADLEHWLEQDAPVSLWFAEALGAGGPGVYSPAEWWRRWAQQTRPEITPESIFHARDIARAELEEQLTTRPMLIGVRADSSEEAAAFACAVTQAIGVVDAAVVSDPTAWRFIDRNPGITMAIAANPEIAAERATRAGQTLVVPLGISDARAQTRGAAANVQEKAIILARPHQHEFVDALLSMGLEPSDAERLSLASGRSWTVYRRLQAYNPAVLHPAWLDRPNIHVLSLVCLIGSWSVERTGDVAVVAQLAGRPYDDVERDLRAFATIDDAPVVSIGKVWKARSPLELLYLAGPQISSAELNRFFTVAEAVLSKPHPALALEPEKRWAASIYGAARAESDLILDALCDGIAKLAVVGPRVDRLAGEDLPGRAAQLVHRLLGDANGERWYSLSGLLPQLAETAPDAFLMAVEAGLRRADGGPLTLIRATSDAGSPMGGCHHSGLLWALERLAWDPTRLARIAATLAAMSEEPIKGHWGNSPFNSLKSLLRPWWPQTTATDEQRLKVIDRLREAANDVAWRLMLACVDNRLASASANAHPHWREDNAGAPSPSVYFRAYAYELVKRVLEDATDRLDRIICLLDQIGSFGPEEQYKILGLAEMLNLVLEDDRELLRTALRRFLASEGRQNRGDRLEVQPQLDRARAQLDALATPDPVAAARWLFQKTWLELPSEENEGDDDWTTRSARVDRLRVEALAAIITNRGLVGVDELARIVAEPCLVGWTLAQVDQDDASLIEFVLGRSHPLVPPTTDAQLVAGLVRKLDPDRRAEILTGVASRLGTGTGADEAVARLYALAPNDTHVWRLVDDEPEAIRNAFWRVALPNGFIQDEQLSELVDRWLRANRPRSALVSAAFSIEKLAPKVLFDILDRIRRGEEPDGTMLDAYRLGEAFEKLDTDDTLPVRDVALLQFAFFAALRPPMGRGARKLTEAVLSDPALFTELITLVYKPHSGESVPVEESMKGVVESAWEVLHSLTCLPAQSEHDVDTEVFNRFVGGARELCVAADRAEVADKTLGGIFAYSPNGVDGRWPHECVRKVMERDDAEHLRRGFVIGIFNKRGTWSRSLDEGGAQERELASRFAAYAEALAFDAPLTAAALRSVADRYADDATREDLETRLRIG